MVLVQGLTVANFDLHVSLLPVASKADMGGGLIWRARDAQNYYLTRANPLEQNIQFYRVVKGVRYKLANFDYIISVDTWHVFRVVARDNHIQIIFDGQTVFDMQDETFSGQIGLWPKADAVTYFDDLRLSVVKEFHAPHFSKHAHPVRTSLRDGPPSFRCQAFSLVKRR